MEYMHLLHANTPPAAEKVDDAADDAAMEDAATGALGCGECRLESAGVLLVGW